MKRPRSLLGLLVVFALVRAAPAQPAAEPVELFAQGQERLAAADFDGARQAWAAAAQAAPENKHYADEYMLLRRVMKVRDVLDEQSTTADWELVARSLRAYYYERGVLIEALRLDRTRYEREVTAESVAMLAETLLELGRHVEALDTVATLDEASASPRVLRLKGIALAREGHLAEARTVLDRCADVAEKDASAHLELARLYALLGDGASASSQLALAIQWTPPSRIASLTKTVKQHRDFSGIAATETFAVALRAESKVQESSCSGGSSCGSCPSRSTCSDGESHK